MKGNILTYDIESSSGIISAEDGNRYKFTKEQWKDTVPPKSAQVVDFEIDNTEAKDIYILKSNKSTIDTDEIKEKFDKFKNSDNVQNVQTKVQNILNNGMKNKVGFILSIVVALSLFLPILSIPFLGSISLIDDIWGKFIFIGIIAIAILFYSGAKQQIVKIAVGIVSAIIFLQFYSLITDLINGGNLLSAFGGKRNNNINLFELLEIGIYVTIPSTLLLIFTGFSSKYMEKHK
jgi:hypothetical protein